jgi:hypothetical protein
MAISPWFLEGSRKLSPERYIAQSKRRDGGAQKEREPEMAPFPKTYD